MGSLTADLVSNANKKKNKKRVKVLAVEGAREYRGSNTRLTKCECYI